MTDKDSSCGTGGKCLSPRALAERWDVTTKTLANWRWSGVGPTYIKVNGNVRYRLSEIEAYEAENTYEPVA